MAITKGIGFNAVELVFDPAGNVTDVQVDVTITISENGVPTNLQRIVKSSIWSQLTAPQQAQMVTLGQRFKQLALANDVPIPLGPL